MCKSETRDSAKRWIISFYVKGCGVNTKGCGMRIFEKTEGQHQSQWILMKDAALDKDPQSIIFKVFIAVG